MHEYEQFISRTAQEHLIFYERPAVTFQLH